MALDPRRPPAPPDTGTAARRLSARALEAQYGSPGPINQSRPVTDPQNQTSASLHSLHETARTLVGMITDCTAIGNAYRVQFEKAKQPVVAFYGSHTTNSVFGARELTTLQPGTMVTCIWHPEMPFAQILSVTPPIGTAARSGQQSIIHGASRARVDEGHKRPFRLHDNGGIPSFLAGRPFDAITCGETGWITETGLKAFVDSFMALFGVDESCQISFHYHDMLCRIAGYQLQIWSSIHEHESFNDQEEALSWTGWALYPWENMGLAARADPTVIRDAAQWQQQEPWYSNLEPIDDHLMPWHREREWHGYLGQGGKRSLVAPPVQFTDSGDKGSTGDTDRSAGARTQHTSYSGGDGVTDPKTPGLFDAFVTADGRYCMQTAKGFSFVKRGAIMLPSRRHRPEDQQGDTPETYRFSSLLGGGPEHKITGDIQTHGENKTMNRVSGILDLHAYMFNYAGVHPFFYHSEDHKLYEESEADWCGGAGEVIPDYSPLASESYLDAEDYRQTWHIDHRYGEQQFYSLSSGIDFLEDGSVVIFDGFGGTLRMAGGSVEISAPGDVWLKPGRNAQIWSGRDTIVRAKHSFDITASEQDGRIKADHNLMMLSGNSGEGGMLFESRGTGNTYDFENQGEQARFAGIVLRSLKAPVVNWSSQIYLRTGGPGVTNEGIILDADRGAGQIATYSQVVQSFTDQGLFVHFGVNGEQVDGPSSMLTATNTVLAGDTVVSGGLVTGSAIFCDGSVLCTGGVLAVNCPQVGCLEGESLQAVLDAAARGRGLANTTIPRDIGQPVMDNLLTPTLYDEDRPGHQDVILKTEFNLRTQDDYRSNNFLLYEDRWQQLERVSGRDGNLWAESPVLFQGQETYPYPGKEAFATGDNFVQQDLTLFDPTFGRSHDRGRAPNLNDNYADPQFGTPQKTSLQDYRVMA